MSEYPTQKRIKELLHYDEHTGMFSWKVYMGGNIFPGDKAGSKYSNAINIGIDGKQYLAHRLSWIYVYGENPDRIVDHKNRDPYDNRLDNLRLATYRQNQYNRNLNKNSTTKVKGVTYNKRHGRYIAYININSKYIHIGTFNTIQEAKEARENRAKKTTR